jgi:hypothetical protein
MNKLSKMMLRAGLAALALGAAGSASAGTFLITYSGVVSNGGDDFGNVFGAAGGSSLTGMVFLARYTLTVPTVGSVTLNSSGETSIFGGSFYDPVAPVSPLSATLTINNITRSFGLEYSNRGYVEQRDNFSGMDRIRHETSSYFDDGSILISYTLINQLFSFANNIVNTTDPTASLSYGVRLGDIITGNFHYLEYLNGSQNAATANAGGSLMADRVAIEAINVGPPSVPEPASWALMLGGFALTGGALRGARRRGFVKPVLAQ